MVEAGTAAVDTARELARRWAEEPRWKGVERTYSAEDVVR
ncbi:isocitrate lyase, partial [Streptomyces mobaraensis NBRC 13819 = DSM 40847]